MLENALPERAAKVLRWLRHPKSKWVRIPLGLLFIGLSMLWFLPVIGIELLPLGLLLIAQDIPFLRKPMANLILWLEKKWRDLLQWWRRRRSRKTH